MAEARDQAVDIPPAGRAGTLTVPEAARAVVVFAHGSGSSRFSPRNRTVAEALNSAGLGTLLFDLLSEAEARDRRTVFDIARLARRLCDALDWLGDRPEARTRKLGLFGASTGAAAALAAAAARPDAVYAVVSRGGRPDLAMADLDGVRAPTLLIVGGRDREVRALNERAFDRLGCDKRLEVVPGAGHLFEEYGALGQVCDLAEAWFLRHA
ncbi:hydrolase [Rhodothalassium salexigens]|uniref:alpha/beta family hydrolase n=1 Tax=Rhodothalassium salexigens TaxID=1086 RepID=UPI001912B532|nr:hydrolase [Rhodothalassium salexigens]MBK5919466.1 hydrolase [Rhodothalassium salexigens]